MAMGLVFSLEAAPYSAEVHFTRAELEAFRGHTLPDLAGPHTRVLFVGINPGLRSVANRAHFGGGSNRFYPALHRAGIVDRRIDASRGLLPDDRAHLLARGVGLTSIVPGASARADELTPEELVAGALALAERVRLIAPATVAILGVTAYRIAFGVPGARVGRQRDLLGGAPVWIVPNPSGLNRHSSLDDLARAYREVAVAAGIDPFPMPPPESTRR